MHVTYVNICFTYSMSTIEDDMKGFFLADNKENYQFKGYY